MTEISDELRCKLIKAFGLDGDALPKPMTGASSQVSALSGKGGGHAQGGGKRARATEHRGGAASDRGMTISEGRTYRVRPRLIVIDGGKR